MAQRANEDEVIPVAEAETQHSDEDSAKARAEAYNVKGNEAYRRKGFSDAIRFYTEGIEVNCKDDELKAKLYSNRAKAHFRLENLIDSLDDAKVATDLQPSFVKAIISGASACVELKEFEEAVTWCEKGLAIDKENPTLLELRNKSVNEQAGKSQEKIEEKDANECNTRSVTEETLDSDANDDNLRKIAELLMNEGNDEFKKRDFGNAVHLYTEGIKVRCKDGELKAKLYSNRSTAYFKLGNFSDSLRDAKIATDLQPSFVKTVVRGASACVQLNRFEEAITWCDKGLDIDRNNPKLLELRNSCVTEQSRLQQLQGENATEDPPETHTAR